MAPSLPHRLPPHIQDPQNLAPNQDHRTFNTKQAAGRSKRVAPRIASLHPQVHGTPPPRTHRSGNRSEASATGRRGGTRSSSPPATSRTRFKRVKRQTLLLLDLTAAYNTVWLCGLHLKLFQTLPDCHLR